MNVRLLEHLQSNYRQFLGESPPSRRSLMSFTSGVADLSLTNLYEMIETGYEAVTNEGDGYKPSVKKLCAFLGESPEDVFGYPLGVVRVDDGTTGVIAVPRNNNNMIRILIERLRAMDDGRMADVIERRFGLLDGHEYTLEEIGLGYGVTRERIRQVEDKALKLLRQLAQGSETNVDQELEKSRLEARSNPRRVRREPQPATTVETLNSLRQDSEAGMRRLATLGISI